MYFQFHLTKYVNLLLMARWFLPTIRHRLFNFCVLSWNKTQISTCYSLKALPEIDMLVALSKILLTALQVCSIQLPVDNTCQQKNHGRRTKTVPRIFPCPESELTKTYLVDFLGNFDIYYKNLIFSQI